MIKFKTEAELCQKFVEAHPRREHLYFEVHGAGGRIDILHKEISTVTIYEAKLRFSIELLEQCINRKEYAHYVYALIPDLRRRNMFLETLFKDYGIGIITFWEDREHLPGKPYQDVTRLRELTRPILNRHPKEVTLYEENRTEVPGMKQGGITPFGIMVKKIKETLAHRGKSTIDDVFKSQSYYGTLKQFKNNMYAWIRHGVITGIEMEKGNMWLTEKTET